MNNQWTYVNTNGVIPKGRKGHYSVASKRFLLIIVSATRILVHGGSNADSSQIYNDAYILDVTNPNSFVWTAFTGTGIPFLTGHGLVNMGDEVLFIFGEGKPTSENTMKILNLKSRTVIDVEMPLKEIPKDNKVNNGNTKVNGLAFALGITLSVAALLFLFLFVQYRRSKRNVILSEDSDTMLRSESKSNGARLVTQHDIEKSFTDIHVEVPKALPTLPAVAYPYHETVNTSPAISPTRSQRSAHGSPEKRVVSVTGPVYQQKDLVKMIDEAERKNGKL